MGDELGGGVELDSGEEFPGEAGDAEVLDDDAVRLQLLQDGELLGRGGKLGVIQKGVEGDIDLPGGLGTVGHGEEVPKLVGREIDGIGAGGEGVEAEVDCVGACGEGGEGGLEGARGGEKFDVVHEREHSTISICFPSLFSVE